MQDLTADNKSYRQVQLNLQETVAFLGAQLQRQVSRLQPISRPVTLCSCNNKFMSCSCRTHFRPQSGTGEFLFLHPVLLVCPSGPHLMFPFTTSSALLYITLAGKHLLLVSLQLACTLHSPYLQAVMLRCPSTWKPGTCCLLLKSAVTHFPPQPYLCSHSSPP